MELKPFGEKNLTLKQLDVEQILPQNKINSGTFFVKNQFFRIDNKVR